jgi:hypothetical protein
MWKDYRISKAAVMLNEWCRKWAAYLSPFKGEVVFRKEFPRLYELRDSMKNPDAEDSCLRNLDQDLQHEVVRRIWSRIELDLRGLDADAWTFLKSEALLCVNTWDEKSSRRGSPRGRELLLNILYQAKAYNFLKTKDCSAIHFITRAPKKGKRTPDLEGISSTARFLCEVKTINRSEEEVYRQRVEKKYLHDHSKLAEEFFAKVGGVIENAKVQLEAYDPKGEATHIVYVIMNFDDFWGDYKELNIRQLDEYLCAHPVPGIELVLHNLWTVFNRSMTLKCATVVNDE